MESRFWLVPCEALMWWRQQRGALSNSTSGPSDTSSAGVALEQLPVPAAPAPLSPTTFAQQPSQYGKADEARAMLLKAVAAVKADKTKALDMFTKGEGGFLDRDLYVFCDNVADGKVVAIGNPNAKTLLGQDARTLKDSTGKEFGLELFAAGQKPEGQITEVSYMFVRPGPDTKPVPKVSLVTRAGDIYCGVGYYK
jgi:hypothetical protein